MIVTIMRGKVTKKFIKSGFEYLECDLSSDSDNRVTVDLPSNPSIKIGDNVTISITPWDEVS